MADQLTALKARKHDLESYIRLRSLGFIKWQFGFIFSGIRLAIIKAKIQELEND